MITREIIPNPNARSIILLTTVCTQHKMATSHFFFTLVLISVVVFLSPAVARDSDECVYTLYVKTGSIIKAGTDSSISVTFADSHGNSVNVPDLEKWGLMGRKHDYYERGNTDIFTGLGPCIGAPICYLNLTSDGLGDHHGWFCDSVEITSTGPHKGCKQSIFYVDQWVASNAPPYQLSTVIDGCNTVEGDSMEVHGGSGSGSGPFVVRNKPIMSASA